MKARLKVAEQGLLYTQRHCKGDASETGLVQFAQGIMDLDQTRLDNPTHVFKNESGKETECIIPFSSDIKFNAFIRDVSGSTSGSTDSALSLYLKGAPERILNRCSKILINGEEQEFTEELKAEVEKANSDFGALEREFSLSPDIPSHQINIPRSTNSTLRHGKNGDLVPNLLMITPQLQDPSQCTISALSVLYPLTIHQEPTLICPYPSVDPLVSRSLWLPVINHQLLPPLLSKLTSLSTQRRK